MLESRSAMLEGGITMRHARRLARTALPIAIAAFASATAFHALAESSRPLQPESTPVEIVASRAAEAGRSPSTAVVSLPPAAMDTAPQPKARALPLAFEENVGQAGASVRYLARGAGSALYLSTHEAVLTLRHPEGTGQVLNMRLVGDRPAPRLTGEDPLAGISNYFIGNDPARWRTGVTHYGKVRYAAVYPGIDLVYYGREGQLEYDFVVAPGADPHAIRIEYSGATSLRIADDGDLVLDLAGGEVRHHAPVVYQELGGGRRAVAGRFVLEGPHRVGFEVGEYDRDRSLVIDPVLAYSSYLGGSAAEYLGPWRCTPTAAWCWSGRRLGRLPGGWERPEDNPRRFVRRVGREVQRVGNRARLLDLPGWKRAGRRLCGCP